MKHFGKFLLGIVTILFALNLQSCSNDNLSVNSSESMSESANLEFLPIVSSSSSLQKKLFHSKFIERKKGGKLHLKYDADSFKVDIKLKIHKESISQDNEFLMNIDSDLFIANLDVVFGPHGTQFSIPAELDIKVEGLDLSNFEQNGLLDVYYDNKESGRWERMDSEEIKIDFKKGKIEVKKAKLPHFSRYAVAWSR